MPGQTNRKMKEFLPQVVTANRLTDGEVVWLGADGWTEIFGEAAVGDSPAALARLEERARADEEARLVLGSYAFPVEVTAEGPQPLSARERIRAAGPTNRLDLGKQAGNPAAA
jgi:hypothetical protein